MSQAIPFIPLTELEARRTKLTEQMANNSALILLSAEILNRNADTEFPFRQDSDFWYITGFNEPDSIYIVKKDNQSQVSETLFVQPKEPTKEIWTGFKAGIEGARALTGVSEAFLISQFETKLPDWLQGVEVAYFEIGGYSYPRLRSNITEVLTKTERRHPAENLANIHRTSSLISKLRLFKSGWELDQMRLAAKISVAAHKQAMRSLVKYRHQTNPVFEYQIQADLEQVFRQNNSQPAYTSIVASGPNACILHYVHNDNQLQSDKLLLIDAAAEYNLYASDITRTYPINGQFSPPQKTIYNLVLQAQEAAIQDIARPNSTTLSFHQKAVEVLTQGLLGLGVLKGKLAENLEQKTYFKYYMHGTGHYLGLDVHDSGPYKDRAGERAEFSFQTGMAVTVEPGLYFQPNDETVPTEFRGIGIRVEDDIIKTENGVENLTQDLEKKAEEIEEMLK